MVVLNEVMFISNQTEPTQLSPLNESDNSERSTVNNSASIELIESTFAWVRENEQQQQQKTKNTAKCARDKMRQQL